MAGNAEAREADVVRVLRALTVVTAALALLAVAFDRHYLIFAAGMIVPSSWMYWRPRWGQLVAWMMWMVPLVMLGLLIHVDHMERIATPSTWLIGGATALIMIVMPLVRISNKPPRAKRSKLPSARVVRK